MSTITWLHLSDLHFRAGERHTWDEDIVLREIYRFDRRSARDVSRIAGRFCSTGFVPSFVREDPDLCEDSEVAALFQRTDT